MEERGYCSGRKGKKIQEPNKEEEKRDSYEVI